MPKEQPNRLVTRRRFKNVIEAPIPADLFGATLARIEAKLNFISKITFIVEFLAGLFVLLWLSASEVLPSGVHFFATTFTALYCVVILFHQVLSPDNSKLRYVFGALWLAAACTPISHFGHPEIPIVIAGVLAVAYSLIGDQSLLRLISAFYLALGSLFLMTAWLSPERNLVGLDMIQLDLILILVAISVLATCRIVVRIQSTRIFGNSIKGLEGMQQALAELHNSRVNEIRNNGSLKDGTASTQADPN